MLQDTQIELVKLLLPEGLLNYFEVIWYKNEDFNEKKAPQIAPHGAI